MTRRKKRNPKGTVAIVERGGTLSLRFRVQGKQYRLALGLPNNPVSKKVARGHAANIQHDIAYDQFDPTLAKYRPMYAQSNSLSTIELFENFIQHRQEEGTSGQAISSRYKPMLANLKRFESNIASPDHAREFISILRSRQSPRIANQNLTMLKAFGKWCVANNYLDNNPYMEIKPLKSARPVQNREPFSLEEVKQFFIALKADPVTNHYHDFCLILLSLGIRPSEAIGLRWQHLNLDEAKVTIKESLSRAEDGNSAGYARVRKPTKTETTRVLPLSPLLITMFTARRPENAQPDDLIFLTPKGHPIDDRRFRERIWKRVCSAAGITYRPPYTSRHTLISHGIEKMGWTLPQAAQVAGHKNTRMVMETYGHALEKPEFPDMQ